MATLYLITKSPFIHNDPSEAVRVAILQRNREEKIGVVLLQDAVLGVKKEQFSEKEESFEQLLLEALGKGVDIYALEPDLKARAIKPEEIIEGVAQIGYPKLVDLIMDEYEKIVSWT